MIGLCFLLHLIMAVSLLFDSLGKDIRRTDIWLHSPASMHQLIGAKFLLILLATGFSLLLCGMIAGISYYVGEGAISIADNSVFMAKCGCCCIVECPLCHGNRFFLLVDVPSVPFPYGWFSIIVIIALVNLWIYWMGSCLVYESSPD